MSIADLFRRRPTAAPTTLAYKSIEEVEAMSTEEQAQYVVNQLPTYTGIFATFGKPSAWPTFGVFSSEQQRQITQLYDDWNAGKFDMIPGVTKRGTSTVQPPFVA